MVQPNSFDHCIAVDATDNVIIDSKEYFPLFLTKESLNICGGRKADKRKAEKLMQLTISKQDHTK